MPLMYLQSRNPSAQCFVMSGAAIARLAECHSHKIYCNCNPLTMQRVKLTGGNQKQKEVHQPVVFPWSH